MKLAQATVNKRITGLLVNGLANSVMALREGPKPQESSPLVHAAYYERGTSDRFKLDTAYPGNLKSHVDGIEPSKNDAFHLILTTGATIYIPNILNATELIEQGPGIAEPHLVTPCFIQNRNGSIGRGKVLLKRRILKEYTDDFGGPFKERNEKMDMLFGSAETMVLDREGKAAVEVMGAWRVTSFPIGLPLKPEDIEISEVFDMVSGMASIAAQRINLLKTYRRLEEVNAELTGHKEGVRELFSLVRHDAVATNFLADGYVQLALQRFEDREQCRSALEKAKAALDRGNKAIYSLLGNGNEDRMEILIDVTKTDFNELVSGLKFLGHNVKVKGELPEIWTDIERVGGIISGLIENSTKYGHEGPAEITFRVVDENEHREIEIRVADNGFGIEKEHLERIFSGKFRAHKRIKGTGTGLRGFRKILEKLEGRIWAESEGTREKGFGGSTFVIRLPID
jgi:anti-sigma regulatory factor (Ser/Thr protein kinase)